jgi:hypothetical protein
VQRYTVPLRGFNCTINSKFTMSYTALFSIPILPQILRVPAIRSLSHPTSSGTPNSTSTGIRNSPSSPPCSGTLNSSSPSSGIQLPQPPRIHLPQPPGFHLPLAPRIQLPLAPRIHLSCLPEFNFLWHPEFTFPVFRNSTSSGTPN